ncbi:hypothetical protein U1Q18_023013, partial [Sarracenia purpurea var. burkii]
MEIDVGLHPWRGDGVKIKQGEACIEFGGESSEHGRARFEFGESGHELKRSISKGISKVMSSDGEKGFRTVDLDAQ